MTWSSLSLHAQPLSQTREEENAGKIEQHKETGVQTLALYLIAKWPKTRLLTLWPLVSPSGKSTSYYPLPRVTVRITDYINSLVNDYNMAYTRLMIIIPIRTPTWHFISGPICTFRKPAPVRRGDTSLRSFYDLDTDIHHSRCFLETYPSLPNRLNTNSTSY